MIWIFIHAKTSESQMLFSEQYLLEQGKCLLEMVEWTVLYGLVNGSDLRHHQKSPL